MASRWAQQRVHRAGPWVVTLAMVVVSITAGVGPVEDVPPDVPPSTAALPGPTAQTPSLESPHEPEGAARVADPRGEPVRVVIPTIGVNVALVRLGLQADRSMQVPDFGLAGWYTKGPRPGHPGPAVIAAHVDSWAGPDVFFELRHLVAGDRVHVVYDSGDRVTFVVDSSEQTPRDALPVDSIWPDTNDRRLALITCGGEFDRSARHHLDNVIVYATPLVRGAGPRVVVHDSNQRSETP